MHEEVEAGGLLSGDAVENGRTGIDPLDAVMAVARPREEMARQRNDTAGEGMGTDDGAEARPGNEADGYDDLTWPEGYQADPKVMARFVPLAKKLGLSKDSTQSLIGLYAELDRDRNATQAEFIAKNNREWLDEIQDHPEFGGGNLQSTGENVASLMRRYGSPLLLSQIRQMNVQNWPEMFYFLARVSQAVSEDCSPAGGNARAATKSTAQLLFPDLK